MSEPIEGIIPARPGHAAQFDGAHGRYELPILAWAQDGMPLIASGRLLARASTLPKYLGIVDDESAPLVAVAPAGGWRVRYGDFDEPLVGWGVRADGIVVALTVDRAGQVDEADCATGTCAIFHETTNGGSE